MKISYKLLWKTLIGKNMSTGHHVSLATIVKICETLQCDLTDVIALVPDNEQ